MSYREEWRYIPGYGDRYQINTQGNVRCWYWKGRRVSRPHLLQQYVKKSSGKRKKSGRRYVKLTWEGVAREQAVINLMVDTWLGGRPPGKVAYHINGDLADSCLHNIGFIDRSKLGRMTGGKAKRRPVVKIAPDGEIVACYPSAREAARQNFMSYQAVIDRCNGKIKKPFRLDGFTYAYED